MPPGIPGNFGVPKTKGITEFARFRSTLPQSYNIPFVPTDWSQLRLAPYRRTEDLSENLLLTILSLNPTYLFRPPTVTNIRRIIPRRTYETDQNLLLSLLPTTLRPFIPEQSDFVRPWFTAFRQLDPQSQNLLLTLLAQTAAAIPFTPTDWTQLRGVITRRYEDSRNLLLTLLPTTLKPLTAQNVDWQRPQYVQPRTMEATQNRIILPTTMAPLNIQKASDDRSPFVPQRQYEDSQNLLLTLLSTTMRPFVPEQSDFVRSPMMPQRQYEDSQNLSLTLLSTSVIPPVVNAIPKRHLPMMGVGR